MSSIDVFAPADGRLLGTYTNPAPEQVQAHLNRARAAQPAWAALPAAERGRRLGKLVQVLMARREEIIGLVCSVSGKVPSDALLGEILPLLEFLKFIEARAGRLLARRKVATSPLLFPFAYAYEERQPYGVVAVIAPWNYPFQLAAFPVLSALATGNAVCLKLSELSLPVGDLIQSLFAEVEGLGDCLQVIPGDGRVGQALIDAGPDLVFFTGGTATGQRVMEAAAKQVIPLILELGGKDPMLVFDDAPLPRTVNGAVYGAFNNSGQTCIAVERVYVQRGIYQTFIDAAVSVAAQLRVGAAVDADCGAISSPRQMDIIEAHYNDAIAKGAKSSGPLRRDGAYLQPVVLWDVDHSMRVMREETFGPLMPIMPFDSEEQAIELANDSELGLHASVWTTDIERGRRVASRLRVGGCSVNDVIKLAAHPELPFGGVRRSGFGRYHGPEGLLSFCQAKSILVNAAKTRTEPNWFPYTEKSYAALLGFIDFLFGPGSIRERGRRNWRSLMAFRDYTTLNLRQRLKRID